MIDEKFSNRLNESEKERRRKTIEFLKENYNCVNSFVFFVLNDKTNLIDYDASSSYDFYCMTLHCLDSAINYNLVHNTGEDMFELKDKIQNSRCKRTDFTFLWTLDLE